MAGKGANTCAGNECVRARRGGGDDDECVCEERGGGGGSKRSRSTHPHAALIGFHHNGGPAVVVAAHHTLHLHRGRRPREERVAVPQRRVAQLQEAQGGRQAQTAAGGSHQRLVAQGCTSARPERVCVRVCVWGGWVRTEGRCQTGVHRKGAGRSTHEASLSACGLRECKPEASQRGQVGTTARGCARARVQTHGGERVHVWVCERTWW